MKADAIFDGLHQLHLLYDELEEYGYVKHNDMLFTNEETDKLALFLYPRACAILARRTMEEQAAKKKMEERNGRTSD